MTDPHNEPVPLRADEPFEIWKLTNSCNEFICSFETLLRTLWTDKMCQGVIGVENHDAALMEAIREVLTVGNELLGVAGEFHDVHWRGIRGERIIWSSQSPLPRFHGANAHRFVCDIAGNYQHALNEVWPDNVWIELLKQVASETDLRDFLQGEALPSLLETEAQRFVLDVEMAGNVKSSDDSANDTSKADESLLLGDLDPKAKLKKSVQAYVCHLWACAKLERDPGTTEDDVSWQYLQKYGLPGAEEGLPQITKEENWILKTFKSHCSRTRTALKINKHESRSGGFETPSVQRPDRSATRRRVY